MGRGSVGSVRAVGASVPGLKESLTKTVRFLDGLKRKECSMKLTNANFTRTDRFKAACKIAGVEPTKRQASKFRMGKGKAAKVPVAKVNQLLINKEWTKEMK
jgi:hypothetical protein